MNKLLKLIVIITMLAGAKASFCQCVIDNSNTTTGFSPSSLPCITPGVSYSETLQLYIPTSTTVGGYPLIVDSVLLLSVTGMPSGINYASNPSGVPVPGGSNACIRFSGTTNDPAGTYDLSFRVRVWGNVFGTPVGPMDSTVAAIGYYFSLDVCGTPTSSCDTLYNLYSNDIYTLYYVDYTNPIDSGFLSGNNIYGDKAKAEEFDNSATWGYQITGTFIRFGYANTTNLSRTVTVNVWDNTGNFGAPGSILTSQTITFNEIYTDITNGVFSYIAFSTPVVINASAFYVGVTLPTIAGDTVAIVTNDGSTGNGMGWERYSDNSWYPYIDRYTVYVGHAIYPVLCPVIGNAPVADFTANSVDGCAPMNVHFTDLSTNTPTSWSWTFTGGTPSTATVQSPNVTYNSAGTYSVTLNATNADGSNTITKTGYITVHAKPTVTLTKTDAACGQPTGTVTSSVSGGTSPYYYSWSTGSTFYSLTNLTAGNYSVTVTSSDGCTATASITVGSTNALSLSLTKTDATCNQSNGTVTSTVSGGSGYTYSWSNGSTSANLSNVAAGTYSVTVTASNGCSASSSVTVGTTGGITVTLNKTDASCNQSNGSVTSTVSGGSGYTYSWSNGSTLANLSNVAAGTYSVTVTASNGCTGSSSATVGTTGGITVTLNKTDASCNQSNGSVTSTVSGGSGYTYSWSNGSTSSNLSNVAAGNYSVTVTASNGCTGSSSATVSSTGGITVSLSETDATCNQSNGSVTSTVSGGSGYSYSWSNGSTSANLSSVAAGTYSVTVTAANGCSASSSATVNSSTGNVSATTTVTTSPNCGQSNGAAMVTASGGTGGYTYNWSTGSTSATINGIAAGSYTVTVTDGAGCSTTAVANVSNGGGGTVVIQSQINVSCNGGNNGSVTVVASGGTGPYTYSMNGTNFQSSPTFTGLTAASYSFYARDANLCIATTGATITQPNPIAISITKTDVNCFGGTTGTATASVTGGATPYIYVWSNSQSGLLALNLAAGPYTLIVTDNNSCTASGSTTITQPTAALSSPMNVTDHASCSGVADGTASVNASGGTTPYSYQWSNGQNTTSVSGLQPGTYTITVTDSKGCTATGSGTVTQPAPLTVTTNITNVGCYGESTGSISLSVAGGTQPYDYLWSDNSTSSGLTSVDAGSYSVIITDNNECTTDESTVISEPAAPITLTVSSANASSGSVHDGSATVSATGGTPPYQYTWSSGSTTATSSGLAAGSYNVTVADNNNCTEVSNVTVSVSVGINNADAGIRMYPNPNTGKFILEFADDGEREIIITDLLGKTLLSAKQSGRQNEFSLNDPNAGIYFVHVRQDKRTMSLKFSVVR